MRAAWLFAFVVSLSFTACVNHIPGYEEADTRAEAENQESDSTDNSNVTDWACDGETTGVLTPAEEE